MRRQLHARATVHKPERVVLLQAFAQVLGRSGHSEVAASDKVDVQGFVQAWALLGLAVSTAHAAGLFNRYGQDVRGRLPVMVFVESLIVGGPRQLMLMESEVQRGPYKAGQPASHMGKILYPQCRKTGVWPPSDWDPALALRSARLPEEQLALEWVYGYDVHRATSNNIWVNCNGHIVTYAAAVCVVYDAAAHKQQYFRGHDDDICCLALAPDKRIAASGQLGKDPTVLVWDSVSCTQLARLAHGYGYRGIQALCFSSSGSKLACIATDNSHSLFVWHWPKAIKLLERKSQPGAPPAVYGVAWSRFEPDRLVTFGQNHIRFWRLDRSSSSSSSSASGELAASSDAGVFGKGGTHSVLSAAFLPSGVVLTGSPDGAICSWRGCRCIAVHPAHAKGPLQHRPDGMQSNGGVAALVLLADGKTLLSGGADGHVLKWDVSAGDLGQCLQRLPLLTPAAAQAAAAAQRSPALMGAGPEPSGRLPHAIRALDAMHGAAGVFVAGTAVGDIWEVDGDPRILLHGQPGQPSCCTTNPRYPHVFASTASGGKVAVWNAATHMPLRIFPVGQGMTALCAAFSPDGRQLAVGLDGGGLKGFEFHPEMRQVWWHQGFSSAVDVLRYSPDGSRLAAAGHDKVVEVYDITPDGLRRVCRCVGHSSAVRRLDWSADGSCIQSMDQAYELLYFDAASGRLLKISCRDTAWASFSSTLGFPVMGIWPPDSDGTDINSADRSPQGDLLLTADDSGKVKLFNCPCVVEDAPGRCYGGHSSHVTCVRWSADQSYAVSTGGHDRALLQWRLLLPPSKQERQAAHLARQQQVLAAVDPAGVVYGEPEGRIRVDPGRGGAGSRR
ncbi:hypothetical protein OEZ86_003516 [Tetradesmus obliquus]|nr:hypothetical protein OEZ86_003516 [Tetradesmus obliquus]